MGSSPPAARSSPRCRTAAVPIGEVGEIVVRGAPGVTLFERLPRRSRQRRPRVVPRRLVPHRRPCDRATPTAGSTSTVAAPTCSRSPARTSPPSRSRPSSALIPTCSTSSVVGAPDPVRDEVPVAFVVPVDRRAAPPTASSSLRGVVREAARQGETTPRRSRSSTNCRARASARSGSSCLPRQRRARSDPPPIPTVVSPDIPVELHRRLTSLVHDLLPTRQFHRDVRRRRRCRRCCTPRRRCSPSRRRRCSRRSGCASVAVERIPERRRLVHGHDHATSR